MQSINLDLLIRQLVYDDARPYLRNLAKDTILNMPIEITKSIYPYLSSTENFWIISGIIDILGEFEDVDAIPYITPFLQSTELRVSRAAMLALAKIGARVAIPEIVELLRSGNWLVQASAAEALELYRQNADCFEALCVAMLSSFLELQNREDFLLRVFDDNHWDQTLLLHSPERLLREILHSALIESLNNTDWILLHYFHQKSLQICETLIEQSDTPTKHQVFLKIYETLQKEIQLPNHLSLVL